MFLDLVEVTFCGRCRMQLSSALPSFHLSYMFSGFPQEDCVGPSVVLG